MISVNISTLNDYRIMFIDRNFDNGFISVSQVKNRYYMFYEFGILRYTYGSYLI